MKAKMTLIIRIVLSILLVVLIYRETGIFTAIFATTMVVYTELDSIVRKKQLEFNEEILKRNDSEADEV